MISKADLKEDPKFSVFYNVNGDGVRQLFRTRQQADIFAEGMEMMGVGEIIKSYYNPSTREWYRYHRTEEINDERPATL